MKKLLTTFIITSMLLLTGCNDSMRIAKQDYLCRDSGGVYSYGGYLGFVQCLNGERYPVSTQDLRSIVLPPKFYPQPKQ